MTASRWERQPERDGEAESGSHPGGTSPQLERLFRERAADLATSLQRRVPDRELVRDAVQESFARFAALSPGRRSSITRPDAFLFRMGLNLLKDWGRAAATAARHRGVGLQQEAGPDPTYALESRDMLRRLEAALLRLRPRTREIFLAHRLDGLSYAEIAERTGLSIKGVEKHMSKAIAAIDRLAGRR